MTSNTEAGPEISRVSQQEDTRPQTSPYDSSPVKVEFRSGEEFRSGAVAYVPRRILDKCPALSSRIIQNYDAGRISSLRLDLNHLSPKAAHVFLHFLFTKEYECLRPVGESIDEKTALELKTAIEVANFSQVYDMPELSDLAETEIKRLGDKLTCPHLIDLIEQCSQNVDLLHPPGDSSYFESRIRSLCGELANILANDLLSNLATPKAASKAILQSLITLQTSLERNGRLRDSDVEPPDKFHDTISVEDVSSLVFPKAGDELGKSNIPLLPPSMGENRSWARHWLASSSQVEPTRISHEGPKGFSPLPEATTAYVLVNDQQSLPVSRPKTKKEKKKEKKIKKRMLAEKAQAEKSELSLPPSPWDRESK